MNSLQAVLRRGYATKAASVASRLPATPTRRQRQYGPAAVARTQSTPLAVRVRRLRRTGEMVAFTQTDMQPGTVLTPSEQITYSRLKSLGKLVRSDGTEPTESEWMARMNRRRTRLRGIVQKTRTVMVEEDGVKAPVRVTERKITGQKIYLPNFLFRLIRNYTPAGQEYNPFEATFRVPLNITKTDIRSFLAVAYGVPVTYIRTDIHRLPDRKRRLVRKDTSRIKAPGTYKRAVVGLRQPFYYPQAIEDMDAAGRAEREKWIEDEFHVKYLQNSYRQQRMQTIHAQLEGKKVSLMKFPEEGRKKILRKIWERRHERELAMETLVGKMQTTRDQGKEILTNTPATPTPPVQATA